MASSPGQNLGDCPVLHAPEALPIWEQGAAKPSEPTPLLVSTLNLLVQSVEVVI